MEQKNGSIVRQTVGYDRFEGELAYHQLAELYRALRLYVNVFQPSLKLTLKRREGSHIYRRYDAARMPLQRLLAADVLDEAGRTRLVALAEALDLVQALRQLHLLQEALRQLHLLQEALWRHAVASPPAPPAPTMRFILPQAAPAGVAAESGGAVSLRGTAVPRTRSASPQRGARSSAPSPDPFAGEADTIDAWLAAQPERPATGWSDDGVRTERRQRCQGCGDPFSAFPSGRERTSAYCARCGAARRRAQARARMQALRVRHRTGAG